MSDEYLDDDVVETQPDVLPEDVGSPDVPVDGDIADATTVAAPAVEAEESEIPSQADQKTTSKPAVVSLADLELPSSPKKSTIPSISSVGQVFKGRTWIAGVLIGIIVLVFLFIPPVSLGSRIMASRRYENLNMDNPSLQHPDGLTFVQQNQGNGGVKVNLETIPQAHFNAEMITKDLQPAVEALPIDLSPKSPFYVINVKGKNPVAARLEVDIPNAAEPWETLDLYGWDGENWFWIPSYLDRDAFLMVAETSAVPTSVMVMQHQSHSQLVAAEVTEIPPSGLDASIMEADVSGLLIGTMGGTAGDATKLPLASDGGSTEIVPVIRNWIPGRDANPGLVKDMLSFESDRQNHVQELLGIAQSGGYPGLVLDYRSVDAALSDSYATFITDLASAFHNSGQWLGVVVDTPTLNSDGSWNTGGFDWMMLGSVVDQLRITMPGSPSAYTPGGQAEQLVNWAVSQVNREKLFLLYSTLSMDESIPVTQNEIYDSIGRVKLLTAIEDTVEPETALSFTLDTAISTTWDSSTGATSLTVAENTYWMGSPQWLHSRMVLASRYTLGGVVLRDLYVEGNMPGLILAVEDYLNQVDTILFSFPEINWQIQDPNGELAEVVTKLSQPQMDWTVPEITGTYKVMATVAGMDKGTIDIVVAAPAPVVTETIAVDGEGVAGGSGGGLSDDDNEGDEETAADEGDITEPVEGTLKAGFVADVTVPDNTRFEKDEQFTKTWRMRNTGELDWSEDTVLRFSSGTQMSAVDQVTVGAVAAGEDVDISVDMVTPDEDGSFKSTWQLTTDRKDITNGSIYVMIQVGEQAAAPQPSVPAPAPGATGTFELGGHIRDLGMPYGDKMHYSGMNWAKTQIFFGQDASGMVNAAHSKGFKIQLSAIGGAGMVTEADYEQKFASWLASLAAAGADAIEVWNEPNIDREWQIGLISPQSYTNLLCASYNAIKAANPGTAVISAAPAPTGWFGGCGPNGCDDQPWMEGLWNAGAANCMDYIGAHHNAGATAPSARSGHPAGGVHHSWYFLPQTELYYNVFQGTRQIFYTEMGYASQEGVPEFSDQFGWARGTNNSQQAAWLAEAVQLSVNTGMVRCIIVWNIDFTRYGTDPQDGFAIIRPGGGCPACETLHNVLGTR